ncbi:head completion/stabilization protein [Providencia rettgeri]|uniref:head completion/stabilization protein n=1 Tax=Providencia rettgeri TaxID=587 RepID=UPI0024AC69A8|nr:head completion/stabilization protein [Providencia rettgeri]
MLNGNELNYQSVEITNDAFWPDINLADFQKQRKIPIDLDSELLTDALLASIAEINLSLESLKSRYISKGYSTANDVPGAKTKGQNALCAQYKKALYARAKADLIGEFNSVSSRAPNPKQENPETKNSLLAEAAFVIRNMKGLKRVTVAMI